MWQPATWGDCRRWAARATRPATSTRSAATPRSRRWLRGSGSPTIRKAGQHSPIDVAGNHLHRGDRIRRGTQLVRWPVVLRGTSRAYLTLDCPRRTVHRGLGFQEGSKITASLSPRSRYGHATLKVRFRPRPGAGTNGTAGSIYALCASR